MSLEAIKTKYDSGHYEEAYHLLKLNRQPSFEYRVLESIILEELGEMESSSVIADSLRQDASTEFEEFLATIATANILYRRGKYQELEEQYLPALKRVSKDLGDGNSHIFWKSKAYYIMGIFAHIQGRLDDAYKYHSKTLELTRILSSPLIADCHVNLGEVEIDRENYESAFDYFTKGLEASTETNNVTMQAYSNFNLGKVLQVQGDISHAIDHLHEGLNQFRKAQKISGQIITLVALGRININQGNYDESRLNYDEALELSNQMESEFYRAMVYHNLGNLDFKLGHLEEGKTKLITAIETWEKIGNKLEIVHNLFDLILAYIEHNRYDEIKMYMNKLRKIAANSEHHGTIIRTKLLESMILKNRTRLRAKVKAQKLLEELLEGPVPHTNLKIEILLNLLEIKLFELKTFDDETIKDELYYLMSDLWTIAIEQRLKPLQVEVLVLKSKLALIVQDFPEVREHLDKASEIANGMHDIVLTKRIEETREEIISEVGKWKKLVDNHPTIQERIDQSKIMEYLQDVADAIRDHK